MSSVSVVIPCRNEEHNIEPLFERLWRVLGDLDDLEILFIDDGSDDQTLEIIKRLAAGNQQVKYISFARNFGLEAAFRAGFTYARNQWIVQIDGDLQCPPEEIPKLIDKMGEGYDIVFALRKDRRDSLLKIWGSRAQHYVASKLLKIEMPNGASTFRIIDKRVAKKIIDRRIPYPYFLAQSLAAGARHAFVEVAHSPRIADTSKINLPASLRATMDLFIGHSTVPLHFLLFAAAAIVLCFLMFHPAVSLPAALALICVGLWIHGLYIARMIHTLADNPGYLIREANIRIAPEDDLYGLGRDVAGRNG